jgi:hypothetical protein
MINIGGEMLEEFRCQLLEASDELSYVQQAGFPDEVVKGGAR